jgi:hypothetical protein
VRGLGASLTLPAGVTYASLTPAQQQAFSNGDPGFMSATTLGLPAPSSPQISYGDNPLMYQPAALVSMATTPTQTTGYTQGQSTTYPVNSLEGWLAGQAQMLIAPNNAASYSSIQETLLSMAQGRCAVIETPDCNNLTALVDQYAGYAKQAIAAAAAGGPATSAPTNTFATPAPGTQYGGPLPAQTNVVTNAGQGSNAMSSNAPAPAPNPATGQVQPSNALMPYRVSYSGSVTTGTSMLNPNLTVNALPADTLANTGAGGPVMDTGDNTWLWVAAAAAAVLILMTTSGGGS